MSIANLTSAVSNGGGYNPAYIYGGAPSWMASDPYSNALNMTYGGTDYGTSNLHQDQLDPATLAALQQRGWTGGNPIITTPGQGGSQDVSPTATTNAFSPQFQQWMAQQGITPSLTAGTDNSQDLGFYGADSTAKGQGLIGDNQNTSFGNDNALMVAAALGLGGFGALAAAGAGAGAAGGALATDATGATVGSGAAGAGYGAAGYDAGLGALAGGGGTTLGDVGTQFGANALDGTGLDSGSFANFGDEALPNMADINAAGGGGGTFGAGDASLGDAGSSISDYLNWAKANPSLVGAGGSLINGFLGYGAAKNAAGVQANAASNAAAASLAQYQQTRADQAPWRAAGATALGTIGDLMGTSGNTSAANYGSLTHQFNAADLNSNLAPNYQFQLQQGLGATTNAGNAAGFSGNTLKGINDYAQGTAAGAYQQAYNNYTNNQTNIYNRLSNLAGLGQTANQSTDSLGQASTSNANNYSTSGAAATAAGIVGGTNQGTNAINNITGWNYLYSDERLKTDIERIGETEGGVPLYTYRYKAGGPTQVGVMAQEVEKVAPQAVKKDAQGYRKVNYSMLKDIGRVLH